MRVDWSFFGRQMLLVDTAGLTHLTPDARLLGGDAGVVAKLEASRLRYLPGSKVGEAEKALAKDYVTLRWIWKMPDTQMFVIITVDASS